ncbi:four helix bundle protein [Sphingobacterium tabacisoli]|uniref:Four helix bundle protein n=1 Tax=Sphingobacterium tabacisoli TaxID=2044855 RepID=A0ABW5KZG8_9SPHI|nr:four helix bundle protein [Sphingobacterium tabacisoli]
MVKSHKDLKVWKESMLLVKDVYEMTNSFPPDERFTLGQQMRRSAISIPSNIAEGAGRRGNKEWIRFLNIALGSISELETQLEIAKVLEFVNDPTKEIEQLIYFRRMILKLIASLNS